MAAPLKMTKMRAVNILLENIGLPPVTWASAEGGPSSNPTDDENIAINTIDDFTRDLNGEHDYFWNWQEEKSYTANGSGIITLDDGTGSTLRIYRIDYVKDEDGPMLSQDRYVERDGVLYNQTDGTSNFGAGTVKTLKVTYWPEFKDLPESVRAYVVAAATVVFLAKRKGSSPTLLGVAQKVEFAAKRAMLKDQNLRHRRNMLETKGAGRVVARRLPYVRPL